MLLEPMDSITNLTNLLGGTPLSGLFRGGVPDRESLATEPPPPRATHCFIRPVAVQDCELAEGRY